MAALQQRTTLAVALMVLAGCSSTYYATMEKLGYEKRDILVSRVKDARNEQDAAKQQFKTTLEKFQDVTHFNGGDLQAKYKTLSSQYDSCETRAKAVSSRIASVQAVANDLFTEWEGELSQYSDASLRHSSEQKLADTKEQYAKLIAIMQSAEKRMPPVLAAFHDQVLFLKHNLNAQAIASLQTTSTEIQGDVEKLVQEMNASIAEADAFIGKMK